ncbi:MAG: DUF3795 domain-containing protein [Peptococcaceae bacterium]|nr:DUF3795 domain-containing protein [Peptococcaceae bacterium]
MITVCGLYCHGCPSFQKECNGCREVYGKPYWVQYIGEEVCPLFKCCQDKGVENCGKCNVIPCKKWYDLKDPSLSEEEHIKSINDRVAALKDI